jgi:SpoVK/Ycf46/Vps4 family AAA+-type ATPase
LILVNLVFHIKINTENCFLTGLRKAGRFDQEIAIGIPDDKQRKSYKEFIF